MKRREIYTMTFYVLDAYWDDHQTDELGNICSGMNPFMFDDEDSADPSYWEDFCDLVHEKEYTVETGFSIAKEYVYSLESEDAKAAFDAISLSDWQAGYTNLLASQNE